MKWYHWDEGGLLLTGWVDGAVGGDGQFVLGWAALEGEVHGLDVVALLVGEGRGTGCEAEG